MVKTSWIDFYENLNWMPAIRKHALMYLGDLNGFCKRSMWIIYFITNLPSLTNWLYSQIRVDNYIHFKSHIVLWTFLHCNVIYIFLSLLSIMYSNWKENSAGIGRAGRTKNCWMYYERGSEKFKTNVVKYATFNFLFLPNFLSFLILEFMI